MNAQTENQTIIAAAALHALVQSINSYDVNATALHEAYNIRSSKLEDLRKLGYIGVQSGNEVKKVDKDPAPGLFPYRVAQTEFTANFTAKNPKATDTQIKARVKQDVQSLSVWLSTGKFLTNVGRDKPQAEYELASTKYEEVSFQLSEKIKHEKSLIKIAGSNKAQAKKLQDAVIVEQTKLARSKDDAVKLAVQSRLDIIKSSVEKLNTTIKNDDKIIGAVTKEVGALKTKVNEAQANKDVKQGKLKPSMPKTPTSAPSAATIEGETKHGSGRLITKETFVSFEAKKQASEIVTALQLSNTPDTVLLEVVRMLASQLNIKLA